MRSHLFPAIFMNHPSHKINKYKTQLGFLFFTGNRKLSKTTYIQLDFAETEQ